MNDNQSFGPAFDEKKDGMKIRSQHEVIKQFMLNSLMWFTLAEIEECLGFSTASISAQLRHLRKEKYGSYDVQKRRRGGAAVWEYMVREPILEPGHLPF